MNTNETHKALDLEGEDLLKVIRNYRDKELRETDWVAGTDVPQAIKDIFNPYRQLMRDLPSRDDLAEIRYMPQRPTLGDN